MIHPVEQACDQGLDPGVRGHAGEGIILDPEISNSTTGHPRYVRHILVLLPSDANDLMVGTVIQVRDMGYARAGGSVKHLQHPAVVCRVSPPANNVLGLLEAVGDRTP